MNFKLILKCSSLGIKTQENLIRKLNSLKQIKNLQKQMTATLFENKTPMYVVNLDPAVKNVPFGCNIDIRDTVKYKDVMKE
jgi:hypothetical protein